MMSTIEGIRTRSGRVINVEEEVDNNSTHPLLEICLNLFSENGGLVKADLVTTDMTKRVFTAYKSKDLPLNIAIQCLGVQRSTFFTKYDYYNSNNQTPRERLSKELFDRTAEEDMKKDIQKMGMVTPFSNNEGIKNYMSRYVRETLARKNVPNAELRDIKISYGSIANFKREFIPESVRRGDKATKQREKVRTDIFPMLSSGAVTYAAMCGSNHELYPIDNDGIPPELVYNIDQFSIDLDNKFIKNAVRVGPGAKQMAKGQHIGLKSFSEPVAEFTENELLALEENAKLKIAEETKKNSR